VSLLTHPTPGPAPAQKTGWSRTREQQLERAGHTCECQGACNRPEHLDGCEVEAPARLNVVAMDGAWTVLCVPCRLRYDAAKRSARAAETRKARRSQGTFEFAKPEKKPRKSRAKKGDVSGEPTR
jgi:hypothetical protein